VYGGPLLDGFYVADAPEFERWVEGERDRLGRAYARALERLAEAARGYARAAFEPPLDSPAAADRVDSWRGELLARFTVAGISNGPTEAINLLIKKVKRVGHGFRNFANYRLRLLLHCGVRWQTHQTARLRGRSPRLVA
jgi:transposase